MCTHKWKNKTKKGDDNEKKQHQNQPRENKWSHRMRLLQLAQKATSQGWNKRSEWNSPQIRDSMREFEKYRR